MSNALQGKALVSQQYQHAIERIRKELRAMKDAQLMANTERELAEHFIAEWELQPLEEDPDREISSHQDREFREIPGGGSKDFFRPSGPVELTYAVIELPLVPRHTNKIAIQMSASDGWPIYTGVEQAASFRERDHVLTLRSVLGDVPRHLELARDMMRRINVDIARQSNHFRANVLTAVQNRRAQVVQQTSQFEKAMGDIGISVRRKPGAVEPVNVQVKKNVQVLRQAPAKSSGPAEPYIKPDSLKEILGLIDQAGKGFETAPAVYTKLEEEELRTIIVGNLNTVFAANAAGGETFSKNGKSDILLNVPGGAVLIAECHYWHGARQYTAKLEQLFGYVTWRHTVAVMITFSRNKGLTNVTREADAAVQAHASYEGGFGEKTATYRVSRHKHPDDPEKTIDIHHLFFNLAVN